MSTFDSAAVWSATSLAFDEKKIGAAGLSVRQRKLLTLLSQPASIPQLAQSIALPIEDVRTALERFAKLGLAQSSDTVLIAPMPTQLRGTAAIAAPSRLPMLIGVGVAVMLAVSLGAWLLRGDHPSAPISPAAGSGPKASTPTAIGPGDTADSALPPSAARALAVTPQPAPALASAATTNSAAAATAAACRSNQIRCDTAGCRNSNAPDRGPNGCTINYACAHIGYRATGNCSGTSRRCARCNRFPRPRNSSSCCSCHQRTRRKPPRCSCRSSGCRA